MIKFLKITLISILLLISLSILLLSTRGLETDRFNNFIIQKIQKKNNQIDVSLKKIKIKLDIQNINLFLSTKNPEITIQDINIPINDLQIYINFVSLLKSKVNINKIKIDYDFIDAKTIKKVIVETKPTSLKSFVFNNITQGRVKGNLLINFEDNFQISNYEANGKVDQLNINLPNKIKVEKINFQFNLNKDLVLINSLNSKVKDIIITEGSLNIERKKELIVSGTAYTKVNLDHVKIKEYPLIDNDNNFLKNKIKFEGNIFNEFDLTFTNTLEVKNYKYEAKSESNKFEIIFKEPIKSSLLDDNIDIFKANNTKIKFFLAKKENNFFNIEGNYKLNNDDISKFKIVNNFTKNKSELKIDFDFKQFLKIDILNYKKEKNKVSKIFADLSIINNKLNIKNFKYSEDKTFISFKNALFEKKLLKRFKSVTVKTYLDKNENNNFSILFDKIILIKGLKYDSTNLIKQITSDGKNNYLKNITKEIEINIKDVKSTLSEVLSDFRLLGKIERGKFIKISSKSEFSDNKFLDISLKKTANKDKKLLEIYSDISKPLLSEFSFFKGIEGGSLLFNHFFDEFSSSSNIKIENFKVKDAPVFAKLLALADFGGIADLMSGDGISFELLEIKLSKDKEVLKIDEIYAVGPSISILMDGYVENKTGLTSLRGTMVPAKELNKLISKIPILGNILIPKDVGEGLFGVSFKMKGMPGKIKTTVNPIKTITPRFITKALEKLKK